MTYKQIAVIRALKKANASQSRLIEKQANRLKALEGVVEEIKEHVEFVESSVDGVGGDIYKQNFYLDIKRTLSKLEEV